MKCMVQKSQIPSLVGRATRVAVSPELWKPDFFVTLTQNDAWLELPAHITRGAGETS